MRGQGSTGSLSRHMVERMKNRSAPPCAVIPVVAYPDVSVAVAWLEAALGFRVRLKIGDHRAQMWFGSSCLIVSDTGKDNQWATRSSVMLRVPDVDALCARAQERGAVVVHPLGVSIRASTRAVRSFLKLYRCHITHRISVCSSTAIRKCDRVGVRRDFVGRLLDLWTDSRSPVEARRKRQDTRL